MTMGEIDSVLWARLRHQKPDRDRLEQMYQDLQEIKEQQQ